MKKVLLTWHLVLGETSIGIFGPCKSAVCAGVHSSREGPGRAHRLLTALCSFVKRTGPGRCCKDKLPRVSGVDSGQTGCPGTVLFVDISGNFGVDCARKCDRELFGTKI